MQVAKLTLLGMLLVACSLAVAQTAAPTTTQPASQPAAAILNMIPSGTMGFLAVNNVQASSKDVDKFMEQIGQQEVLKPFASKGGFVGLITEQAQLGEGFNPSGGFAAMMLDPQQFKLSAKNMMSGRDEEGNEVKLPVILIVPGSSIESVFSKYERSQPPEAHHVLVKLRMGPMFAAQSNGYLLLSPREDALDAVIEAKSKAVTELSPEVVKMVQDSALAMHVNMKVAGPIVIQMMKQTEQELAATAAMMPRRGAPPMASMVTSYYAQVLPAYRNVISQMEAVTATVKFTNLGPMINSRAIFAKDSDVGKTITAYKPLEGPLLDMVPSLPYIVAAQAVGDGPERTKAVSDNLDKMLASPSMSDIPDATKARLKAWALAANQEVSGMQFYFGQAPKEQGLLAMSAVVQCQSSEKYKKMLADGADILTEVIDKKLSSMAPPADASETTTAPAATTKPTIKITYEKNVGTAGTASVDAMNIVIPELSEKDRAEVKRILGEDKIRLLVAAPNEKTVVLTMGGGDTKFMQQALQAAADRSGKTVDQDARKVLAELPQNRLFVMLFNVANTMTFAKAASKPEEAGEVPQVTTNMPIALSVSAQQNAVQYVLLVPNELIKQLIIAAMPKPPTEPSEEGEETSPAKPKKAPKEDF